MGDRDLAVFNRFADPAQERAYKEEERGKWRAGVRALVIISMGIFVVFSLMNPIFFLAESLVIYNIVSMAMIVSLIIAYIVIGMDHYLRWRWLDPLMFTLLAIAAVVLMRALADTEDQTQTSFYGMAVINLALIFVFAALTFVANFRWFVAWAFALMGAYLVFLALQPLPIFPRVYMVANVSMFFAFACFVNWVLDYRARIIFTTNQQLAAEKAKTEGLLFNVLPQAIANRLRDGEAVADSFSDVTVIFTDIVGFSGLAKTLSPGHLVRLLNEFFSLADQCADRHGVEKVKTIGDAYLAVSGGTASAGYGAAEALNFSRDLILGMREMATRNGVNINLRVGIHTGPVVGGVVGSSRLAYDYWGDTMNIASRIEGAATPGGIAVSEATFFSCENTSSGDRGHDFQPPEVVTLKGVGEMTIRRLEV